MTSKINAGARIWVTALGASLVLGSCTDPDPTGPVQQVDQVDPVDPVDPVATQPIPAAITMVSGNHQEGKARIPLYDLFVVRVTDAEGRGVEGAQVTWKLASGAGRLSSIFHGERYLCDTMDGCTDAHGFSYVEFTPTTVGPIMVTAEAAGLTGSPVTFTADVTAMVISLGQDWSFAYEEYPVVFIGPDRTPDVTVPVGTHVEWILLRSLFPQETARITSTSVPPGGEPFDSGVLYVWWWEATLASGGRGRASFVFVPSVAGTWEFVDQVSGATGTLTAH